MQRRRAGEHPAAKHLARLGGVVQGLGLHVEEGDVVGRGLIRGGRLAGANGEHQPFEPHRLTDLGLKAQGLGGELVDRLNDRGGVAWPLQGFRGQGEVGRRSLELHDRGQFELGRRRALLRGDGVGEGLDGRGDGRRARRRDDRRARDGRGGRGLVGVLGGDQTRQSQACNQSGTRKDQPQPAHQRAAG